jgi:hypothetical protein
LWLPFTNPGLSVYCNSRIGDICGLVRPRREGMGDRGRKAKDRKEKQKKAKLTLKEKRKQKQEKTSKF